MVDIRREWHITGYGVDTWSGKYPLAGTYGVVTSFTYGVTKELVLSTTNLPVIFDNSSILRIYDPGTQNYEYFQATAYDALTRTFTLSARSSVDAGLRVSQNPLWGATKDPVVDDVIQIWRDSQGRRHGPNGSLGGIMAKPDLRIGDKITHHQGLYSEEGGGYFGAFEFVADGFVELDGNFEFLTGLAPASALGPGTLANSPVIQYGASGYHLKNFQVNGVALQGLNLFPASAVKPFVKDLSIYRCDTGVIADGWDTQAKAPLIEACRISDGVVGISTLNTNTISGLVVRDNTIHKMTGQGIRIDDVNAWNTDFGAGAGWGTLLDQGLFQCYNNILHEISGTAVWIKLDLWQSPGQNFNVLFNASPTGHVLYFVQQHVDRVNPVAGSSGGFFNSVVASPGFGIGGTYTGVAFADATYALADVTTYFNALGISIETSGSGSNPNLHSPDEGLFTVNLSDPVVVKTGSAGTNIGAQGEAFHATTLNSGGGGATRVTLGPNLNFPFYDAMANNGGPPIGPDWGYISPMNSLVYNPSNASIELAPDPVVYGRLQSGIIDLGEPRSIGPAFLAGFWLWPQHVLDSEDTKAATGSIVCQNGSTLTDGNSFRIFDGVSYYRFEFDSNLSVGAGSESISFTGGDSAITVAQAIVDAITNSTTALQAALDPLDASVVLLTQGLPGLDGNEAVSTSGIFSGWIFSGLSGGTNDLPNKRTVRIRGSNILSDLENDGLSGAGWATLEQNRESGAFIARYLQFELTFIGDGE